TGIKAGLNLFLYVNDSPIVLVDATGGEPLCVPVNDQWMPKIGSTVCIPRPGPKKKATRDQGRRERPARSGGKRDGVEGGVEGGTATKTPTGRVTEAGAGDGLGGLGEPGDVGTETDVGTGTSGTGSPTGTGTGSKTTTGTGTGTGRRTETGSGKEGESGSGVSQGGSEPDTVTALASMIIDPESLAEAAEAKGQSGDGSPAGSSFGFITGLPAKILTWIVAFGSWAMSPIKKVF